MNRDEAERKAWEIVEKIGGDGYRCIESRCTFPNGCGCKDLIAAALMDAAKPASADLSQIGEAFHMDETEAKRKAREILGDCFCCKENKRRGLVDLVCGWCMYGDRVAAALMDAAKPAPACKPSDEDILKHLAHLLGEKPYLGAHELRLRLAKWARDQNHAAWIARLKAIGFENVDEFAAAIREGDGDD